MTQYTDKRISISADFLQAFANIPQAQQKKVREFVQQFQNNPEMPGGRHYEKLVHTCDSNLRSVRIDLVYRAIIFKPSGNVFILLWVDKHEEAYKWAEKKKVCIHPGTGGIQLIQVDVVKSEPMTNNAVPLFASFSDEQLMALGVPLELMERTRVIFTEDQLFAEESYYPQEAYTSLFMLACGESYENVIEEYNRNNTQTIDTTDFWTALDNNDTLSRFTVIDNSVELEGLLNAPLEKWRVFLHPLQRKIVEKDFSGSARVLGGAGTGKTVVAIHRAKHLLEKVFTGSNDRILFTTFTKNLAADILGALQQICTPETLKRIEVINLDAWTKNYLESKNFRYQVIDYRSDKQKELWEKALALKPADCSLSDQFFYDEWEQVIQPQGINSQESYFRASRTGRGRSLNRLERKHLWPVWEEYRALLNEGGWREIQDLYRDAAALLSQDAIPRYKAIIIDEGQDFSLQAYSMIRAILPADRNDIFIVGDAHQRIYGIKTVLSQSGIKITGRSHKLKVNYRTTKEIYQYASSILTGLDFDDLDGQEDTLGKCQSITSGPNPETRLCVDAQNEQQQIISLLKKLKSNDILPDSICIVGRTKEIVDSYAALLENNGIEYFKINQTSILDKRKKGIRLATMHRVKGIEFDYVILVSVCDGIAPSDFILSAQENETDKQNVLRKERSLLYVALTRARKAVFVTGYKKLSNLLTYEKIDS